MVGGRSDNDTLKKQPDEYLMAYIYNPTKPFAVYLCMINTPAQARSLPPRPPALHLPGASLMLKMAEKFRVSLW